MKPLTIISGPIPVIANSFTMSPTQSHLSQVQFISENRDNVFMIIHILIKFLFPQFKVMLEDYYLLLFHLHSLTYSPKQFSNSLFFHPRILNFFIFSLFNCLLFQFESLLLPLISHPKRIYLRLQCFVWTQIKSWQIYVSEGVFPVSLGVPFHDGISIESVAMDVGDRVVHQVKGDRTQILMGNLLIHFQN